MQTIFTQPRVFIVGDGFLLDQGVTHMLTHETDLLISHALYSDDFAFLNVNTQDQPDMILVNESGLLNVEHILEFISSHPIVKGLLIIVVRLWNSVIDVYESPIFVAGKVSWSSRRITANTINDLLNVVNSVSILRRKYNDQ